MTEQNPQYQVKEVRELHSVHNGTNQLNKFLADGWILLSTATGVDSENYPIHTWTIGRIS
ncbi:MULTISPECIES: hypothetical protein [Yersinia]|uniref:hypothetical protein n=1 Tax=Yersinia TaxID=629 RepID=UPI0005E58EA7|nr:MULTISPECIES: hypothetical protein [Yersinia]CNH36436.1 Uncharacterised protein [Yersinia kristensenii]